MMVPIMREQFYGKYAAKDVFLLTVAYGAYILVPLFIMLRVARTPVFSRTSLRPKNE